MVKPLESLSLLFSVAVAWDGWRPGAHPFDLSSQERSIGTELERHASCSFDVLDAGSSHFWETFEAKKQQPLLITNLINDWPALKEWTSEAWFKRFSGEVSSHANHSSWEIFRWDMAEPVEFDFSRIVKWSPSQLKHVENYFALMKEKDEVSGAYLEPNAVIHDMSFECENDPYIGVSAPTPGGFNCGSRQMSLGGFGTGHGTHMHFSSWQAQVTGNKSWYVFPPVMGDYTWSCDPTKHEQACFPHEEQPRLTNTMCGYKPVRKAFRDNLQFCVQGVGEIVYVPEGWWHSTCSLNEFNVATGGSLTDGTTKMFDRASQLAVDSSGALGGLARLRKNRAPGNGLELMFSAQIEKDFEELLRFVKKSLEPVGMYPGVDLVFEAMDDYCWSEQWMFNLGDVKGALLEQELERWMAETQPPLLHTLKPMLGVEFGSNLGYSAMRIAKHMTRGSSFLCVEPEYAKPSFKKVVDEILQLSMMDSVVTFVPEYSNDAITDFVKRQLVFDMVATDHMKSDYLPTLRLMIQHGLLRVGGMYLADNVVIFNIVDLLRYLRFSGAFDRYILYYTETEYDDRHGQPHPNGQSYPDGVVFATYAGLGKGRYFESPSPSICAQHDTCAACLVNLCGWCTASRVCVPDKEEPLSTCSAQMLVGLFGRGMKCPSHTLPAGSWISPHGLQTLKSNAMLAKAQTVPPKPLKVLFTNRSPGDHPVSLYILTQQNTETSVAVLPFQWTLQWSSEMQDVRPGQSYIARCTQEHRGESAEFGRFTITAAAEQNFVIALGGCGQPSTAKVEL